jgi:hypothetical protein
MLNGVAIAVGTTVDVTDNTALDLTGTIANSGTTPQTIPLSWKSLATSYSTAAAK